MFVRKLVISNLVTRKVRAGLTIAAVALSVSLVVSVTTGYASVLGAVNKYIERFLGSIDAQGSRTNDPPGRGRRAGWGGGARGGEKVRGAVARVDRRAGVGDERPAGADPLRGRRGPAG